MSVKGMTNLSSEQLCMITTVKRKRTEGNESALYSAALEKESVTVPEAGFWFRETKLR